MLDKKISVIVPIYRVESYIEKCIESICNQTYKNLEILLVDDGSPDKCGQICDEFAKKDERIKVFHIKNGGQSHARNVGMEAATGDYIGFVDGDDRIRPNMYAKMLSLAISNDAEIVECNFCGRKQKIPDQMLDGEMIQITGKEAIARQLNRTILSRYPSTSVWSKIFKKETIQDLRFPKGRIHEEYAFLCEAFLNAERYVYINECLYERTLREDSTTAEKFSGRTMDKIYVYQQRNDVLSRRGEKELWVLSKEQEYELLLHYAALANKANLVQEEMFVSELIQNQKKEILKSRISLKKKLQYTLFLINKKLYYCLKK